MSIIIVIIKQVLCLTWNMVSQKLGIPFRSSSAFFDPSSLISVNLLVKCQSTIINKLLVLVRPVLVLTVGVCKREDGLLISGLVFALKQVHII